MRHPIVTEDLEEIASCGVPFQELSGKVVLISGANGFLPAYLVEALLFLNELGAHPPIQVVGLVRNRQKAEARFFHYRNRHDLRFLVQDVSDPVCLDGPVDYVIHAASQASPKYFGVDPVGTLSANAYGTRNLLELARQKRSERFLFFSSAEIYGKLPPDQIPCSEATYGVVDPLQVRSCYAEGKRLGETACLAWHHQFGVPVTIVRPFHTYGPGMALDDGRVFSDFVSDLVNHRHLTINSAGLAVRAYCYLSDAARGFFTVLLQGALGQAYNVGNSQALASVRELADILVGLFPDRKLKVVQSGDTRRPGYLPSTVDRFAPDTTKLEMLGWRARYSILEGFKRTVLSYDEPDCSQRRLRA
jgi:nucleoside-diphosphate-sugar epimerase